MISLSFFIFEKGIQVLIFPYFTQLKNFKSLIKQDGQSVLLDSNHQYSLSKDVNGNCFSNPVLISLAVKSLSTNLKST